MNSTSIWHLLDEEMGTNCRAGFQKHKFILRDLWNFTATLGPSVRAICQPSLDTPKETFKGKCDSISRGAQLHKRRGVAEPQLHWFTSRLFQSSELRSVKRQVQSHQEHTVIFTTFNSDKKGNDRIEMTRWAHQSASWGVLWGRPSVGRHSCRRDIWTVSPQSATWCASAGSPSG